MQAVIPWFIGSFFSARTVSIVTIILHIILSVLKLVTGLISHSAGLIADGIDNSMDTVSSILVWLGIKFKKEKLTSVFIVMMMFFSLWGIDTASINKLLHPAPVNEGLAAFVVSGICGLLMLFLSAYQYLAGKRNSNLAIMCQSIDSKNHVSTSTLVCIGILLSYLAEKMGMGWLYYADAAASVFIGILIFKSAVELAMEIFKKQNEDVHITHFMEKVRKKVKKKFLLDWLTRQVNDNPLTLEEIDKRFGEQIDEMVPKIFGLMQMNYGLENIE